MTFKQTFKLGLAFVCLLALNNLALGQSPVKDVKIQAESADISFSAETPTSYSLEIGGPNDYYSTYTLEDVSDLKLSPLKKDGTPFADGIYKLRITPQFSLTEDQRAELLRLRDAQDNKGLADYRAANNLPEQLESFGVTFSIRDGKFVAPNRMEASIKTPTDFPQSGVPELYASVQVMELNYPDRAMDNTSMAEDDQVFVDDVIVQGSLCVGADCANGENFGSDTERLRENNLRIHFDDTSNSASFPQNDWRLVANDQTNGGRNYFAIQDATAGRTPFQVEAGAPNNALVVESDGDIGINTLNPVVEVHLIDGDSPTFRLEQDGSAGFGSQTWDVAGNETNFFIRDVSNGSQLPFKIIPGADHNSLVIDSDNNIGLGILNPTQKLHVFGNTNNKGNVYVQEGSIGINVAPSATYALDVTGAVRITGNPIVTGTSTFRGDESHFLTTGATFYGANFLTFVKFDATTGRVGIGNIASPSHLLELATDDAAKPNGGVWTASSDRRLKQNIKKYTDGLAEVLKINTVTYNYNNKSGYDTNKEHVGIIAQEMQEVAPYMVRKLNPEKNDYLGFEGTALTFMLVNAVQEQQDIIDAQQKKIADLESELSEVAALKLAVAELTQIVKGQDNAASTAEVEDETEMTEKQK